MPSRMPDPARGGPGVGHSRGALQMRDVAREADVDGVGRHWLHELADAALAGRYDTVAVLALGSAFVGSLGNRRHYAKSSSA